MSIPYGLAGFDNPVNNKIYRVKHALGGSRHTFELKKLIIEGFGKRQTLKTKKYM